MGFPNSDVEFWAPLPSYAPYIIQGWPKGALRLEGPFGNFFLGVQDLQVQRLEDTYEPSKRALEPTISPVKPPNVSILWFCPKMSCGFNEL